MTDARDDDMPPIKVTQLTGMELADLLAFIPDDVQIALLVERGALEQVSPNILPQGPWFRRVDTKET